MNARQAHRISYKWLAIGIVCLGALIWPALWYTLLADLPTVDQIETLAVRPTTRILDRRGRVLYEVLDPNVGKQLNLTGQGAVNRYGLTGVPEFCVEATLATEDSRFFYHPGVDPLAILRATWQNYQAGGEIMSGGSTLTQQVARNLLMQPSERYERTLRRKIREAWLALQIEWRYSKAEILHLYLNQTYYGHFAFGLEAAAQNFFAKPAAQLSRAECALLAGLVQYPSGYDPLIDPEAAQQRQQTVLRLMRDAGFVEATDLAQIVAEPLRYRSRLFKIAAPHFVMMVQDLLAKQLGVDRLRQGGLEIRTTLDLGLQQEAEAAVRRRLAQLNCRLDGRETLAACAAENGERRVQNAAAVIIDAESGEILAMVGSPDYFDASIGGNVNAVLSLRQPGSAIKPFTYAAALDRAWSAQAGLSQPLTPASILPDLPTTFPGGRGDDLTTGGESTYLPKNYDLRYHGPVSVREALANSYNIPAVAVLHQIGVPTLQSLATRAGIRSFTGDYGLALTLGGGEVSLLDLTRAYGIFARGGHRLETTAILAIGDWRLGTGIETLVSNRPSPPIIAPETAYLITDILSDPVARIPAYGERSVLNLPFPAAAKTGTTTDWRDNWTVGYSHTRLVGVWVGNADNTPMGGVSGVDGAGPIWHDLMIATHRTPPPPFVRPPRVVELSICAPSGLLPTPDCPRLRRERFLAGTQPTRTDDQFQRIAIDLATGQRAHADSPPSRTVARVFWQPGPAYAEWMAAQNLPMPPPISSASSVAVRTHGAQTLPTYATPLHLTAPVADLTYAIHPGVPRDRQRVAAGGFVGDGNTWAKLRLMVDNRTLVEARDVNRLEGWWALTSGTHTFWIEGESTPNGATIRSTAATIVVE